MDPGGRRPSVTSSHSKSKYPLIRHISSATSAQPLLTHKDEENQTQHKTPRLDSSSPSSSASFIANNEDILQQIFLCLPPKSLLRFQAVSRQWLAIISNPTLRCLHSQFYPTTTSSAATAALFLFRKIGRRTRELNFISLREEDVNSMGTITSRFGNFLDGEILGLHSCNGLLCFEFNFNYCDRREFFVYNPTTNQHRLIPLCKPGDERYKFLSINIAFDPVKSDGFKLVCVWEDWFENEFRFMVYSSETGVWRETTAETFQMFAERYYFERGVLWNGDLHWVSEWSGTLCFDLDNECLRRVIPNPPTPTYWWDACYFGESGGHLYFIGLNNPQKMFFKVFSLKRDYSEWVEKYSVDVAPLTTLYPSMVVEEYDCSDEKLFDFRVLCFLEDEKEKKANLVISLEGRVISYDIIDMTLKEYAEVDPGELSYSFRDASKYSWKDAYQHIETLACI